MLIGTRAQIDGDQQMYRNSVMLSIKGPTGPSGMPGPTGGTAGLTGAAGAQGVQGIQGLQAVWIDVIMANVTGGIGTIQDVQCMIMEDY